MKPDKAKELIKETFQNPFDKDRFVWFLKNLFPDRIEPRNKLYQGIYIKEAYRAYVRKYEQLGKFVDAEGNTIDLLAVELLKGQSVERARTSQRNFIAQYLKNKNHREGALVAFYSDDSDDWRFSLIKMEYSLEKKKDELTPAKRFSFLVGKDEQSHTAQNQLTGLLTMQTAPVLQEVEAAFNIETVTKEFFEKYKQLFLDLNDHIEKEIKKSKALREELESKHIDSASFTKKLLGQIVFLYFLQKKGWLGVPKNENWGKGDKKFLRSLLEKAVAEKKNFFADYLVYLFYEALATEHRGGSDSSYYKKLDCRIPFLNGGLFEADYDWGKITVEIPNKFFTNTNVTKEGDIGNGILNVFDRYNFTVREDEPLEKEVAVDPEMLGKVFENLLEVKDRKSKGAFYTPREIVHYMCQESLISYLDTAVNGESTSFLKIGDEQTQMFGNGVKIGQLDLVAPMDSEIVVPRKDIEKFIQEGVAAIENDARVVREERETDTYSFQLPKSIINNAKEIDRALANIRICDPAIGSGAFPVGMMNEIVKAREILSVYLKEAKQKDRTPYELKRHAIQECIYGVDIDHSAIDIAKLRLWLSLVVDEDDFYKIKPLPNLDYKIVEGNSLIGYPYEPQGLDIVEKLKIKFFELTDHKEKVSYRKQINEAIHRLLKNTEKSLGYKVDFDFKIHFSEVFHEKKGFDIVIGNPPYISIANLPKEMNQVLSKQNFETYSKGADIYCLFYEKGLNLLRNQTTLCYISSNRFCFTNYGVGLRKYLSAKNILQIINFNQVDVFENANVGSAVLMVQKTKPTVKSILTYESKMNKGENLAKIILNEGKLLSKDYFKESQWSFDESTSQGLKLKIESQGIPFIKWKGLTTNRGITTGANHIFIIDKKTRDELISEDVKSKEILLPVLKGANIKRYYITKPTQYLIYSYTDIQITKYPAVYNYLKKNKSELQEVYEAKEGQKKWYELRKCNYYDNFQKRKLVWTRLSSQNAFSISDNGEFTVDSSSFAVGENIEYLSAILNSKVILFYFKLGSVIWGKDGIKWFGSYFDNIPIPEITPKEQKPFITLVEKILQIKKQDINANTSKLEKQIDLMVYHLYNLTYEEAKIIDPELGEEEFEKYKTDSKQPVNA